MMFLLLNLLQSQQGRLSKVVIVGAVLALLAGVSLLVYFYRRFKRVEKESEEDWDLSRHSLFVNVAPPARSSEEAASPAPSEVGAPAPTTPPADAGGTREFASDIGLPRPAPATTAEPEPRVKVPPAAQEPVLPGAGEDRPTEILASPSPKEITTSPKTESEAAAFDDEVWAGLEVGEQPPLSREQLPERGPLQPTPDPLPVARVDQPSTREPFEPPRIERILQREPYESPRIEPLSPRAQAETTELRSVRPYQQESNKRPERETVLFGSTPGGPSSDARSTEPAGQRTHQLAVEPARVTSLGMQEPSIASGRSAKSARVPAGSVLGLPAEASRQPLILGDPVRPADETGIGALSNYGRDVGPKGGRAGTVALLVVVLLLGGALALYLGVPTIHARVNALVAHMRGIDTLEALEAARKPRALITPSYRPEVNKNIVTARGAVDNISEQSLENLSIEIALQRGTDVPPEIRTVSVTPNPLPPNQRGTFEFEYDGKRGTGFLGYKITKLYSNGVEVNFRTPNQK